MKYELGKSQNTIAAQVGISSANVSQILAGNWEKISDELWRKVAVALNVSLYGDWQTAEIANYRKIFGLCSLAQNGSLAKLIAFDAGFGKTYALQAYAKQSRNAFYMQCERHYTRKVFLQKLGRALGLQLYGTIAEMIDAISDKLKSLDKPLVILDEYDKILEKSGVFDLFKTFYDATLGYCGFILCGTPALEQELRKRVSKNKIGYTELLSRVGREYVHLAAISTKDVRLVCEANGIAQRAAQEEIRIQLGSGDLRQLRHLIMLHNAKKELSN